MPQNVLRNIFFIWETYSEIKKILESFSQNKTIYTDDETPTCTRNPSVINRVL